MPLTLRYCPTCGQPCPAVQALNAGRQCIICVRAAMPMSRKSIVFKWEPCGAADGED